jgi:hypothetical protein
MNTTTKLSVKVSALVVAGLSALSMQAHAGDYTTYQRVVLGQSDLHSQAAVQESQTALKLIPGSYARYLIVNGMPQAQALAQARNAGEEATWQAGVAPSQAVALSGFQLYERAMGRAVTPNAGTEVQAKSGN